MTDQLVHNLVGICNLRMEVSSYHHLCIRVEVVQLQLHLEHIDLRLERLQ